MEVMKLKKKPPRIIAGLAIVLIIGIIIAYPAQKIIGKIKVNDYLISKGESVQDFKIESIYSAKVGGYDYFVAYYDEPSVVYVLHYKYGRNVSIDDAIHETEDIDEYYHLASMTSEEQAREFKHLTDEEIAAYFQY